MRRRARVDLHAVVAAVGHGSSADEIDTRALDGAEALLRRFGLRRWSLDDVADRAGIGRTSIYRRFGGRDDLVHAVLARELGRVLAGMQAAMAATTDLESKAVAAVGVAVAALDGSVVDSLLRSDPETFLPFLTTEAGPLLAVARQAIMMQVQDYVSDPSPELAEAAARFGLSFILTRDTVLPMGDPVRLEESIRSMIRPFLVAFGLPVTDG